MDAVTWRKAKDLLAAILTRPAADRESYLARECADPVLRQEVRELLKHSDDGLSALDTFVLPGVDLSEEMTRLATGTQVGPYVIVEQLGVGGMGEVYRAHDPRLGRDVAIKIICGAAAPDAAAIRRFTREAQTASALSHPNIVTVFDVGESEWGPYIVMEMVEGRTLRDLLRSVIDPETAIRIGRQVARALNAAHAAGIVHRDIKPENVMVRDDGHVKVLDFGISRTVPRQTLTDAETTVPSTDARADTLVPTGGGVVGTVAYMSPEQARGEAVDGSTDIFALGLVFYELFAGQHPFAAADEVGRLARLFSDLPLPPSQFSPGLPASLDALILRMVDKDPRGRPAAADIEEVLAELAGEHPRVAGRHPVSTAPPRHTVGRERIRAEVVQAFNSAEEGRGSMIALSGEPGIGKTTLVEDFVRDLVAAGRTHVFARGRCSERLAGAGAYLPWLEALETMRDDTGRSVSRVMQTLAPTWYAQIAPLASTQTSEVRLETPNRTGSQEWMKRELGGFLEEVSRHRPLVLFFDDVQWADVSTVDLIGYLGTRLASMRVLVLVTYRPTDLMLSRHPFLRLKLNLQSRSICRDVALQFLGERDVDRYLALEFAGHQFPATFAALVHAKTEGNPLFVTDLLRALRDRHVLEQDGAVWRLTQAVTAFEDELPESIRAMIDLKVAQLDEADRSLAIAASVQGYEFDSAVVANALGRDQGDVEERLDTLGRIHALVQPVREVQLPDGRLTVRYRFVHALYQNALYGSLGPSRRASLSAAVAEAFIAHHGASPVHASELALLFEAARDFPRAAEFFLIASGRARQIFADSEALVLAQRGLEMVQALPETPERAPRELANLIGVAIADFAVGGYASEDAERISRRGLELADQIGEQPQVFTFLAAVSAFHFMRAELRAAVPSIERMFRMSAQTDSPIMSLWSEWAYGATFSHLGERLRDAQAHLERGARLYDPTIHSSIVLMTGFDAGIGCHFQAARMLWLLGYPDRAIDLARDAIAIARNARHPMMTHFALFFEAWIRQHRREPLEVLRITGEVLPEIDRYGYKIVGTWTRTLRGWALAQTGRAEEGERILHDAIAEADAIGVKLLRPNFLALLAESLALQNRIEEALLVVADALAIAEQTEERCYSSELHRLEGDLLMRLGHSGTAERVQQSLQAAVALAHEQEARSFELRAATTLARFHRQQGRAPDARAALAAIVAAFDEGFDTPDVREARSELNQTA